LEYEVILTALLETARGRAFLQEYARRSRASDTETLLTAIGRIEGLLSSKGLEPGDPSPADDVAPPDAANAPDVEASDDEASDIEIMAAEIIEIDGSAGAEREKVEILSVEVVEIDTALIELPAVASTPIEVATRHVTAIEFLGPDLTGAALAKTEPPAARARREQRVPFADIRALSDEEKIALFT